jgi:hypothetical protein
VDYLIPLLVTSVLAVISFSLLSRGLPERRAVLRILFVAFLLRVILALVFQLVPGTRIFHEDAAGYEWLGAAMADGWRGEGPPVVFPHTTNYGYVYFVAAFDYLFGSYQLFPSLLNTVIGCASALLLYRIGLLVFVEPIARRALLFALFFPSMILWSSIAVKDTSIVFLLVATMYAVVQLRRKFSLFHSLLTGACLCGILTLRFYIFYVAALAIAVSLLFSGRRIGRAFTGQVAVVGALVLFLIFLGLRKEATDDLSILSLERVSSFRAGMASSANSGWRGDVDLSTPSKAIAFLPLGLSLLLFSPFPWQFTNLRALLTLPEMIVWWGLTFAWLRGMRFSVRKRMGDLAPVLCFAVILAIAYSPVHGNVGVAFRQRSQILIFLFLFAAVGQYLKQMRAKGLSEAAIEEKMAPKPARAPAAPKPAFGPRPLISIRRR